MGLHLLIQFMQAACHRRSKKAIERAKSFLKGNLGSRNFPPDQSRPLAASAIEVISYRINSPTVGEIECLKLGAEAPASLSGRGRTNRSSPSCGPVSRPGH